MTEVVIIELVHDNDDEVSPIFTVAVSYPYGLRIVSLNVKVAVGHGLISST